MFETAELGRKVGKKAFEKAVPELRVQLLELQQALRKADFPVIVLFSGVDGAGKGATVNLLNEWMDPRWIETYAYLKASDEEQERPEFWRYWRDLPERGQFGLFLSAWYSPPFLDRVHDRITDAEFDRRLDRIIAFERVLADDGALILKFWMHLGKAAQKRRLKALENDPLRSWRVTPIDWQHWRMYDRFVMAAEHTIRRTSFARAPWKIVEGADTHYRSLTVATIIRDAVSDRLNGGMSVAAPVDIEIGEQPPEAAVDSAIASLAHSLDRTVLTELDMNLTVSKKDYRRELPKEQGRVNALFRRARENGISIVAVFEGWDAAGKGGAIRRLTQALDARDYAGHPDRRADRRGASPPLPVAVLAPPAARRAASRSSTAPGTAACWSSASRASRPRASGSAPTPRSTSSSAARRARHRAGQVLAAHHGRGAAAALRGAPDDRVQAVEADRRGLAQPREVGPLRASVQEMVERTSPSTRRGPWSRATANASPGSRSCAPSAKRWRRFKTGSRAPPPRRRKRRTEALGPGVLGEPRIERARNFLTGVGGCPVPSNAEAISG